jgi:hypothetical protein
MHEMQVTARKIQAFNFFNNFSRSKGSVLGELGHNQTSEAKEPSMAQGSADYPFRDLISFSTTISPLF